MEKLINHLKIPDIFSPKKGTIRESVWNFTRKLLSQATTPQKFMASFEMIIQLLILWLFALAFTYKYLYKLDIFLNWDSLYARLNSNYEVWSYKKKKRLKYTGNLFRKNLQLRGVW